MTRDIIIYELARYAHPSWYHSLLSWETEHLNLLLNYYKSEDQDKDVRSIQFMSVSLSPVIEL